MARRCLSVAPSRRYFRIKCAQAFSLRSLEKLRMPSSVDEEYVHFSPKSWC